MRVLVCDDHALMVQVLAERLRSEGHEVVEAQSPEQALVAQQVAAAELCVLDVRYGNSDLDGADLVERLLAMTPRLQVLLLTSHPGSPAARRAVAAGAHGLLDKSSALGVVAEAVDRLAGGRPYPLSRPAHHEPTLREELSPRERDVLALLARGCGTAEVSALLGISVHTVRKHVQRLLQKLQVPTRLQAVAVGVREGLVVAQPPAPAPDAWRQPVDAR